MSVIHSNVATVCTASHLTNWNLSGHAATNGEENVLKARIRTVDELISAGLKRDFALLEIIITNRQRENYQLDPFITKLGFKLLGEFDKDDKSIQREQASGNLFLYAARPVDYEKAILAYKKELDDELEKKFPPKKPDPKRLAVESLLLSKLRKAGMVQDNTAVNNPLREVLIVKPEVFARHIKMKYQLDVNEIKTKKDWKDLTIRQLKEAHVAWQNELF